MPTNYSHSRVSENYVYCSWDGDIAVLKKDGLKQWCTSCRVTLDIGDDINAEINPANQDIFITNEGLCHYYPRSHLNYYRNIAQHFLRRDEQ